MGCKEIGIRKPDQNILIHFYQLFYIFLLLYFWWKLWENKEIRKNVCLWKTMPGRVKQVPQDSTE